jgi:adenylate cyclase
MAEARETTVEQMLNVILPLGRIVETMASFLESFPDRAKTFDGAGIMESQIRSYPQVYGLYFALEENGAFYQVVQLPKTLRNFGPKELPVPDGTKIVFRKIDGPQGHLKDTYLYQSSWGNVTGSEVGDVSYDPKSRAWYEGARKTDDIFVTKLYRFASTGKPGVTFAKRVLDDDGKLVGVVGLDMTLDRIAGILNSIRIGEHGRVFLLDKNDKVIAYAGTQHNDSGLQFASKANFDGQSVDEPVIAKAITDWIHEKPVFYEFFVEGKTEKFLASAAPIPEIFGVYPTLGFVVPENHFVGAIKETTLQVLYISLFILVVAITIIVFTSRLLSRQIHLVALEAGKISQFDLKGDFQLESPIFEVDELSRAVSGMKTSLKSFGAYVPVEIVRSIVGSGESVKIGGTDRELSIFFSDIEGFTNKTENLSPEILMSDLSDYFASMEEQITKHHGTIDKYIGDAIMAFWNAPTADPNHAINACRAILACRDAEERLNTGGNSSQLVPVHTRFGLHCASVVIGNVGSSRRLQYTALGSAVNLASRVEGLNKVYGTTYLATESIVAKSDDNFLFRFVDKVSPAGTTKHIAIYELLGELNTAADFPVTDQQRSEISEWDDCIQLYDQHRWEDALSAFENHRHKASIDSLVSVYADRCREFSQSPPPPDWDGILNLEKK